MTIQNIHDIAFCIPTYNRPEECQDTIDRIIAKWPGAHVYVADDSDQPARFNDAETFHLKPDEGISVKRNILIERTREPLVFLLDDDMKVDHVKIEFMLDILSNDPSIGTVAVRKLDKGKNRWSNSEGDFFVSGKRLFINRPARRRGRKEVEWIEVDYAPMCFLARRQVFDVVRFDFRLKTCGEHVDFFLRLAAANGHQQLIDRFAKVFRINGDQSPIAYHCEKGDCRGRLGVALDVNSYVVDTGSRPGNSYNKQRARGGRFRRQMMAMWRFESIIRWNSRVKAKAIY